jgi:hypothetical protein
MSTKLFFLAGLAFHGALDLIPKAIEWLMYGFGQ